MSVESSLLLMLSIYVVGALIVTYMCYRIPWLHDKLEIDPNYPPHAAVISFWPLFAIFAVPIVGLIHAFVFMAKLATKNRKAAL